MRRDLLQQRLYEMEEENPSPKRTLSLSESIRSWLLSFVPREVAPWGNKYKNHGTYDDDTARMIGAAENVVRDARNYPTLDEEIESNYHIFACINPYLERGWEVPLQLMQLYQNSAEMCIDRISRETEKPALEPVAYRSSYSSGASPGCDLFIACMRAPSYKDEIERKPAYYRFKGSLNRILLNLDSAGLEDLRVRAESLLRDKFES